MIVKILLCVQFSPILQKTTTTLSCICKHVHIPKSVLITEIHLTKVPLKKLSNQPKCTNIDSN